MSDYSSSDRNYRPGKSEREEERKSQRDSNDRQEKGR